MRARRRRGQFPKPKVENGQWKIRYRTDVVQEDGSRLRVLKTKCLGPAGAMTKNQAKKAAARFLQPINDVEEWVEHAARTVRQLIDRWRQIVKPNLKLSTQLQYEWAFQRIEPAFSRVPLGALEKGDVQAFLTAAAGKLAPKSFKNICICFRSLLSLAKEWGWIQKNPAAGKMTLPKGSVRKKIVLAPEQFWAGVAELRQPSAR